MSRVLDVPFDDANDVYSIELRLHPIDVGYDLRSEHISITVPPTRIDELRASYATRKGERRVVSGPRKAVIAFLRRRGYRMLA